MTDSPTLTEDQARAEAALFDEAERTATQVRQTTSVHPDMTLDDAYRVQAAWLDLRLARGERDGRAQEVGADELGEQTTGRSSATRSASPRGPCSRPCASTPRTPAS